MTIDTIARRAARLASAASDLPDVRQSARVLGLGAAVFGVFPTLAPRAFARLFGLPAPREPRVMSAYRSIGVRDVVLGAGLWFAASRGERLAPWVLARAVSDGGDVVACLLAIRAGARDKRFILLTGLAFGASMSGFRLWRRCRAVPV